MHKLPVPFVNALEAAFGSRWHLSMAMRAQHGRDESPFDVSPPDAVVFANSTAEVAIVLAQAQQHQVPVIAYGAGTSLEGQLLAVAGGVSLDLSQMNQILQVHTEDMTAIVQPGVTREHLNEALRHHGLFFPVDPGANASLGGMAATRASGTNAVRYGTMRENVLALEFVAAGGEIIRTGTRARKSSAGYDLTRLLVGSEGTLGVITELTLRLYPLPEAVRAAICSFPSVDAAVQTAMRLMQLAVPLARCELLDTQAVKAVNARDRLGLRESPMLLMEFHGTPAGVAEQVESAQEVASELGGERFEWADTPEKRNRLWAARHHAYLSALQMRPGCRCITTDTCVPISRLAENINASIAEVEATGLPYFVVGHVGDGNFHLGYLIDPDLPGERELAERLSAQMVRRALGMGGTCTGEHGIGLHKQGFLLEETGEGAVRLMQRVKNAFDPSGILNPGKIFTIPGGH
jgi:D-lactate dehydrogenase (cytochrome)